MFRLLGLVPKPVTRVSVAADAGCAVTTRTIAAAIDSTAARRAVKSLRTRVNPFREQGTAATIVRSPPATGQRFSGSFGTSRTAVLACCCEDPGMTELLLGPLLR